MGATDQQTKLPAYRGRFAPSPTGPLHFGSMLAAVASFLQARSRQGSWLVRIEDIDPPREVPGAANTQLETLKRFGMMPDEPVIYQSRSSALHNDALESLLAGNQAFHCGCSRADLPGSGIYPGTCRQGLAPGKTARSVRFRVTDESIAFVDAVFGRNVFNLARSCGDFVIRRADGLIAYQLAVVVDDLAQGITEVARGSDLLDSTPRQIALYRALGAQPPAWMHLPLAVDEQGNKLSKSSAADPIEALPPELALRRVLAALGHRPPASHRTLDALWDWAIQAWNPRRITRESCMNSPD